MQAAGASAEREYRRALAGAAIRWIAVAALAAAAVAVLGAGQRWVAAGCAAGALLAWPRGDPSRWRRGAEGERLTAALLERLPQRRWIVLHDRALGAGRSNVDHLVVGPTGVWLVDSKSYRGRVRAGWRSVRVAGRRLDTSTAAWEAEQVARRLGVWVEPLVAVHGGTLPRRGRCCDGVRVLPAEAVARRIRGGRKVLSRREVADLSARADRLFPPAAAR